MRLSWNEIRIRAAAFAREWQGARYEKGESQTFYNELFEVFGVTRRRVATFEEPVKKLDQKYGFIDLFWKGVLLVEQKSAGRNLTTAKSQAFDYFPGIKEADLPRYVLVSDFQLFELYDLDEGTETRFALADLPGHIEAFGFILGVQKRTFRDQDPVNILASELMGRLHDALKESGYEGHDLERLLVRLLFCLFADDTGIFEPRGIFQDLLTNRTAADGSDTGAWLSSLFDVLNTHETKRQKTLDEDLNAFPYVNGDLFQERLPIPAFNSTMRKVLLEACAFNWDAISPAIFGALFQSVMDVKARRKQGAHYTTERNIMKVIQPLFLDGLRAEFTRLKDRRDTGKKRALEMFRQNLGALRFFDPACGCGNFLIIAYRELRLLELDVLRVLYPIGQRELDVAVLSLIDVDQFYGIEISEFPARIAEVALWMMDHIMNNRLSLEFGESYLRIPLKKSPHIRHGDALEIDWADVLPPKDCSYILGNPPFSGFVLRDDAQRQQMKLLLELGAGGSRLDLVAAWFLKAGAYVQKSDCEIAFVATNSVTQGEQVAQLWPALFDRYKLEITFAHRTFAWDSDARGVAHVHAVIVGLAPYGKERPSAQLFTYERTDGEPSESLHKKLTAYLFSGDTVSNSHLVVYRRDHPFISIPSPRVGSKPVDGGYYIIDGTERIKLVKRYSDIDPFIRPYIGGQEFINGGDRWIFCLQNAQPQQIRRWPEVKQRIEAVRDYRETVGGNLSKSLAAVPTQFHVTLMPKLPFLAIPEVSSERREYVPIGWLEPPCIPSNKILVIENATLDLFGLVTSRIHMAWLRHIGGRLKSDYQYSGGIVYNTFPWPELNDPQRSKLSALAQAVLDARLAHPGSTLADLYDPDTMPPDLRKAHKTLDAAVDKLYRAAPLGSDRERVEHLFGLYEKLAAPALAMMQAKVKRARKK
jgi:hypothetical protein